MFFYFPVNIYSTSPPFFRLPPFFFFSCNDFASLSIIISQFLLSCSFLSFLPLFSFLFSLLVPVLFRQTSFLSFFLFFFLLLFPFLPFIFFYLLSLYVFSSILPILHFFSSFIILCFSTILYSSSFLFRFFLVHFFPLLSIPGL